MENQSKLKMCPFQTTLNIKRSPLATIAKNRNSTILAPTVSLLQLTLPVRSESVKIKQAFSFVYIQRAKALCSTRNNTYLKMRNIKMTDQILLVAEFTIQDGKSDAFKKLLRAAIEIAIEIVRSKEPDALSYEFYPGNHESKCYAVELYKDSKALLAHIENVGGILPQVLEVSQFSRLEIYGNATDELREAVAPFGAKIFFHLDGFTR